MKLPWVNPAEMPGIPTPVELEVDLTGARVDRTGGWVRVHAHGGRIRHGDVAGVHSGLNSCQVREAVVVSPMR